MPNDYAPTPGLTGTGLKVRTTVDLNVPSQYSPLKGGNDDSNTVIQAICPGRSVDHGHMNYDAVAVALVLDALRHDGPARASRIPKARCDSTYAGDIDPAEVERQLAAGVAYVGANYTSAGLTESEPVLMDYATRAAPRPRATLRVHPRRLRAGTSATVSVRATGTAHGQSWPLAGGQVGIAGRTAVTNARGLASVRLRAGRRGALRVHLVALGLGAVTGRLPVE